MNTNLEQLCNEGFGTRFYDVRLPAEKILQRLEEELLQAVLSLDDLQFEEHPRLLQGLASEVLNARNTNIETALKDCIKQLRQLYRAINRGSKTRDPIAQYPVTINYWSETIVPEIVYDLSTDGCQGVYRLRQSVSFVLSLYPAVH